MFPPESPLQPAVPTVQVAPRNLLKSGHFSAQGPRPKNDDYVAVSQHTDFFCISDGIGGAPYGDIMSRIACNRALRLYDAGAHMEDAFAVANELASEVAIDLQAPCGATLLMMEYNGSEVRMASVGDTLGFRLRQGALEQITHLGRREEGRNALESAIGYGPVEPSIASCKAVAGDRYLLATDGLWETLGPEAMSELLAGEESAPVLAQKLAEAAIDAGGQDNATAVVVIVE